MSANGDWTVRHYLNDFLVTISGSHLQSGGMEKSSSVATSVSQVPMYLLITEKGRLLKCGRVPNLHSLERLT